MTITSTELIKNPDIKLTKIQRNKAPRNTTQEILEEFIANQNSKYTQRVYSYELRMFFSWAKKTDITDITQRDILAYKQTIATKKPATIAWKLCAIRQFFKYAVQRGIITKDITEGVTTPTVYQKEPDALSMLEAEALLNAPDRRTTKGKRDFAMLHLMLSTGVRLGELTEIKVGDFDYKYNKPVINIIGKGKKPRSLRIPQEVKETISDYLMLRKEQNKGDSVFLTAPRKREIPHKLSPRGIQKIIKRYAHKALIHKKVSPHTLRHTAATLELEGGANLMEIKNQLGHSSVSVTQRYLHTRGEALDKHPLYNGR